MILKTNKGDREIKTQELDFTNLMCDLEDNGVDIMALLNEDSRQGIKLFSTMRSILAVLIGERDLRKAGALLSEHLKNGGSVDDVMNVFTGAMQSAGFGIAAEESTEAEQMTIPYEKISENTEITQN